jgi:hypothetical protein
MVEQIEEFQGFRGETSMEFLVSWNPRSLGEMGISRRNGWIAPGERLLWGWGASGSFAVKQGMGSQDYWPDFAVKRRLGDAKRLRHSRRNPMRNPHKLASQGERETEEFAAKFAMGRRCIPDR